MTTATSTTPLLAARHSHPGDEAIAAAYARDGYADGGRMLDSGTLERLRAELARVLAENGRAGVAQPFRLMDIGRDNAPVWQIVNIWQASADFAALLRHPRILALAGLLSGARSLKIWHDQIQYKPAGIGGVNMWHQDAPYWGPLSPQGEQITAWIALDDAGLDNGCMSMVPGSHRWGDAIGFLHAIPAFDAMPASYDGHQVRVEPRPVGEGHVHFHHSLTWHGSHANTSTRPRRAIALHFMTGRTVLDGDGQHCLSTEIHSPAGEPVRGALFPELWWAED
jgi:phytanoyl-CoA hydroxylase